MGMEIKVIFIQHENVVICMLEGLCSSVGAVVENVVPSLWDSLCIIQLPCCLTRSLLQERAGDEKIYLQCPGYSESFYISVLERFLSFSFNFVTAYLVKANFKTDLLDKILIFRGLRSNLN